MASTARARATWNGVTCPGSPASRSAGTLKTKRPPGSRTRATAARTACGSGNCQKAAFETARSNGPETTRSRSEAAATRKRARGSRTRERAMPTMASEPSTPRSSERAGMVSRQARAVAPAPHARSSTRRAVATSASAASRRLSAR